MLESPGRESSANLLQRRPTKTQRTQPLKPILSHSRKVKYDLGSVDNTNKQPYVRCRRESKECYFSTTWRKRKHKDGRADRLDGNRQRRFQPVSNPRVFKIESVESDDEGVGQDSLGMEGKSWGDVKAILDKQNRAQLERAVGGRCGGNTVNIRA